MRLFLPGLIAFRLQCSAFGAQHGLDDKEEGILHAMYRGSDNARFAMVISNEHIFRTTSSMFPLAYILMLQHLHEVVAPT